MSYGRGGGRPQVEGPRPGHGEPPTLEAVQARGDVKVGAAGGRVPSEAVVPATGLAQGRVGLLAPVVKAGGEPRIVGRPRRHAHGAPSLLYVNGGRPIRPLDREEVQEVPDLDAQRAADLARVVDTREAPPAVRAAVRLWQVHSRAAISSPWARIRPPPDPPRRPGSAPGSRVGLRARKRGADPSTTRGSSRASGATPPVSFRKARPGPDWQTDRRPTGRTTNRLARPLRRLAGLAPATLPRSMSQRRDLSGFLGARGTSQRPRDERR